MRKYFFCLFFLPLFVWGQQTETLSLDGTWQFLCSAGMNSGKWSTIRVPSQWEQQGFGCYTYGRYYIWDKDAKPSDETGVYRRKVKVPSAWQGKKVAIVFDGVMTDTEVLVNGQSAGPVHQGGFYVFKYDITDKLNFGKSNDIEVRVAKQSANKSVNDAERRADWWLFGGIYRSVRLTAVPQSHIERVQVDARADGTLRTMLHTEQADGFSVRLTIDGRSQTMPLKSASTLLESHWKGIKTWDPEHPNLYNLQVELLNTQGQTVHTVSERIGFRTIEFRPSDGIYLNGVRLLLKGVNRHCFTPEEGRTPNHQQNLEDARLIKQMNMNAVRSHYSPDRDFLNICDSVGLLYFDEFCGWHGRYDAEIGRKLLEEQMASDQNHPCIFMWGNGNEGGWNRKLDGAFSTLDLQQRHVAHPWQDFNGIDTHHYPSYYTGPGKFQNGDRVFMPTEFLHSQYDKGGGAGLEDYWEQYSRSPLCAGGFIWSFADEAVMRRDGRDTLDTDGPNAPDGIVGPHREKEGSFYTIRDVWSPIQISPLRITPSFRGDIFVSNHFLFSNLDEYRLRYTLTDQKSQSVSHAQTITLPATQPGETAKVSLPLPADWQQADILRIDALSQSGDTVNCWTWPVHPPRYYVEQQTGGEGKAAINGNTLTANGVSVTFADGILQTVSADGRIIPFNGGPLPVGIKAKFKEAETTTDGRDALYTARYTGDIDYIQWRMRPDGTLLMQAVMLNNKKPENTTVSTLGLTFSYPEQDVKGMTWLGKGPYRVWKNRQRGQLMGLWHKDYNNTVTGETPPQLSPHGEGAIKDSSFNGRANKKSPSPCGEGRGGVLIYPEFKGYHANLYWATVETHDGSFTVSTATENIFLRMLTPEEPLRRRDGKRTMPRFPAGDISFLYEIPAIESFRSVAEHGPKSQPSRIRLNPGDEGLRLTLLFDFKK